MEIYRKLTFLLRQRKKNLLTNLGGGWGWWGGAGRKKQEGKIMQSLGIKGREASVGETYG